MSVKREQKIPPWYLIKFADYKISPSGKTSILTYVQLVFHLAIVLFLHPSHVVSQPDSSEINLRVALPHVEPLVYRDKNNNPSGFQIEILKEIAESEGWNLTYIDGTWNECYMAIQNGQVDLIPCLTRTREREVIFDFVEPPFYQKWTAVYIRNDEELSNVAALNGSKIGLMRSDQNASAFINYIKGFQISWTPVWYPSYKELFQALNDHEVKAVVAHMDESSTYEEFRKAKSVGLNFTPNPITIGILKDRLPEIRETIGSYLEKYKNDPHSNYNLYLQSPMYIKSDQNFGKSIFGKWTLLALGCISLLLFIFVLLQRSTLFQRKQAVKASEQTYQTMVQNLNVCLSILKIELDPSGNMVDASFLTANPEYCHFFNSSLNDFIGISFKEAHGEKAFEDWKDLFAEAFHQKKSVEFERTEQLTGAWIGGRVVLFHNQLIALLFTDQTEIKRNSQALIENESKFHHFFDNMTGGVIILEPSPQDHSFSVLNMNKVFCDSLDLNWHREQKLQINDIFPLENESLISQINKLYQSEEELPNISFNWKYGSRLFDIEAFQLSKSLTGVIFVEQTEEYAKEILHTHHDDAQKSHLQTVHECLIYVNRDHEILWANNEALRYTGMSLAEIQNKKCDYFGKNCESFLGICPVDETFQTKKIITEEEFHSPNGNIYSYASIPHFNDDGEVAYVLEAFADITELRKREEKNTQFQKMEILGRLSGGIAHDFNNILQAVLGFGDLLKYKLKDSPNNLKAVQAIIDAGKHGSKLVQQLMSFSRRDQYNPVPLDLNEQISNLATMLHRIIGDGISLNFTPFPAPLPIYADPNQLDQAIINLCINARDAVDYSTGEIQIIPTMKQGGRTNEMPQNKYICLEIRDNGCGIDPIIQNKIFEPFFTTKDKEKGTGLGLASVNDIVIRHSGWINVDSKVGQGTSITLNFPMYLYHQASAKTRQDQTEFTSVRKDLNCGVLLAEDNEKTAEFTTTILENHGCKVFLAINGEEAVEEFIKNKDEIDIFLFDIMMPKMTGPTAYNLIKEKGGKQPVLFCSGVNLSNESIDLENASFLAKPFRTKQLMEKLHEILQS